MPSAATVLLSIASTYDRLKSCEKMLGFGLDPAAQPINRRKSLQHKTRSCLCAASVSKAKPPHMLAVSAGCGRVCGTLHTVCEASYMGSPLIGAHLLNVLNGPL